MMDVADYKTDYEIQQAAFAVLQKKLGVVNWVRFMQQYDKGFGNYTLDRDQWQQDATVDSLFEEIQSNKR